MLRSRTLPFDDAGIRTEIRQLRRPGRHRAWPYSINLSQRQPIRVVCRPCQEHRYLHTEYKTDCARREIVCLDKKGKPQFHDLLFHRGDPCSFAFDLLVCEDKDWRMERLLDRKQALRRLLGRMPMDSRLRYVGRVDRNGTALFQRVCKLDLEGIVQEAEVRPVRQRARRQQMVQDSESRIFVNGWAGRTLRA